MRMMGKLSEKEREQIAELEGLESWVPLQSNMNAEQKARSYALIAHDWLVMDFEERAVRMFVTANKTCPGYFHQFLVRDAKEDPQFALIIVRMASLLISLEVESGGLNH